MSRGKRRFRCRACRRFFIDPDERIGRQAKAGSTAPDSTPEVRLLNPRSRKGLNRKERPSPGHLILKLRSIAEAMGRAPTTTEIAQMAKEGRSYQLDYYYEAFGSYLAALKKARIKTRYRQEFDEADRERMLDELRALSRKLKRPLIGKDVMAARKKKKVSPINHFQIAFETIPKAIAAAGVAPKTSYSREEMIAILRKLDARLDRPVQAADIDELYRAGKGPAASTIEKKFGGIAKARKAARIKNHYHKAKERTKHWQKYTQEQLIAQLKALGKKLGRKPTDRDINRASKERLCASAMTFQKMFGNLPNAYHAAGFLEDSKNHRRHTDEQILAALKKLTKELGRFPGWHDIRKASIAGKCPTAGTIVRRIGKLAELRARAGFEIPRSAVRYTDEQIIAELKRYAKELGRIPSYGDLVAGSKAGRCPSPSAIRRLGKLSEIRPRLR